MHMASVLTVRNIAEWLEFTIYAFGIALFLLSCAS